MIRRIEKMITTKDDSILYEFDLNGYVGYYYLPSSDMQVNLINYGFTSPCLVVYPDKKIGMDEVEDLAEKYNLKTVAIKQGTGVLFMNPKNGENWDNEQPDGYIAAASNFGIAQSNFRDGLAIMEKPGCPDERTYTMLGSCVRMYVYAIGSGADYISNVALKMIGGNTSLGDLGMADYTMTCCTLINGTKLPAPEKNDIIVVSVNNSEQYNEVLKENCGKVVEETTVDMYKQFNEVTGDYRRWSGKIMPAYNYEKEGICCYPGSCMVPISDDNARFGRRMGPWGPKEHKVGYVVFHDQNADIKNGNLPLLFVFHGGGDCAIATASLAEWPEIAQKENFLVVAVEMHMNVSAKEVVSLLEHLKTQFSIDESRVYATGFSMGGIKSWDCFQEVADKFAAVAPMDAIQAPGGNTFFTVTEEERLNKDTLLPVFYVGGVASPLTELPKHDKRAVEMMQYVAKVNKLTQKFDVDYDNKDSWSDPYVCCKGDEVEILHDDAFPESEYHLHHYHSEDGNTYTEILAITEHKHEIRVFTNKLAWQFLKKFRRNEKGEIVIS